MTVRRKLLLGQGMVLKELSDALLIKTEITILLLDQLAAFIWTLKQVAQGVSRHLPCKLRDISLGLLLVFKIDFVYL